MIRRLREHGTSIMQTGMCGKGISFAMAASSGFVRTFLTAICNRSARVRRSSWRCLLALPLLGMHAFAQNTTISGTVYDPRTTSSALPLPNVLVYVTTGDGGAVAPGVQCLTSIHAHRRGQLHLYRRGRHLHAGRCARKRHATPWSSRRASGAGSSARPLPPPAYRACLHMPADHTQGDIPMIAIATGSVDALECVFTIWAFPIRSLPTTTAPSIPAGTSIFTRAADRPARRSTLRLPPSPR